MGSASFHADDLHGTGFLCLFSIVKDGFVRGFDGVKALFLLGMKQNRFPVFLGHLKLVRCQFNAIVAPDAFLSLKRDDDHEWFY